MRFASFRDNMPNPFGGARTEPVFGVWEVAVIGATSPSLNARADSAGTRAERNADLAVPFGSSCRPRTIFQRLCATRTVRLIERTEQPVLMAGQAPENLPTGGLCLRRVLQEKGTVSALRTEHRQGSRWDEQNPSFAAAEQQAPTRPDDGPFGDGLLLKGR